MHSDPQKSFGLEHRTILIFMGIVIVLYAVFAIVCYHEMKYVLDKDAATRLDGLASVQKDRTEDYVTDNLNTLELLLRSNNLSNLVDSFMNDPTAMKLNVSKPDAAQIQLNAYLNNALFQRSGINTISILSTSGIVVASTDQSQIGVNASQQTYFQKGQLAADVSTFFKDPNGSVGLYLTGPILYDNQHVGVVVLEANAQKIFDIFGDNAGLGSTGQWTLLVKEANGDALTVVPGRFGSANSVLTATISKSQTTAPVIRAINGQEGVYWTGLDARGVPVVSATRYIPETGWGIALKVTLAEIYQPLTPLRDFFIMVFGLLVALFLLFSLHAARMRYLIQKEFDPKVEK